MRKRDRNILTLTVLALIAPMSFTASAVTFTVTNLNDSGPGSLRKAIMDANTAIGDDEIVFADGLSGTITMTNGPMSIESNINITAPGSDKLTVNGNATSEIFDVTDLATVTISGMTITNADTSSAVINNGVLTVNDCILSKNARRAIYNQGTLTINRSTLSDNMRLEGSGGAIYNDGNGNLTVNDSLLTHNHSTGTDGYFSDCGGGLLGNGGAITSYGGQTTINNSKILENATTMHGGGLYSTNTRVIINNSTLSKNLTSSGSGGGIFNICGDLTITGSNISGHAVVGSGGGIWHGIGGNLTINNSTVSGNSAAGNSADNVGYAGHDGGGGVYTYMRNGKALLTNSTVSGNSTKNIGGGILLNGANPVYTSSDIVNTTFSSNSAGIAGGGIYISEIGSSTQGYPNTLMNSTITGNSSGNGSGGGIFVKNEYSKSMLVVGNSLIIGNQATIGRDFFFYNYCGDSISKGYNVVGSQGDSGIGNEDHCFDYTFHLSSTDIVLQGGVETVIGALAENGGPTKTHLPVANSIIIDGGSDKLIPTGITTDQRGTGFPRIVGASVDIGAVELGITAPIFTLTVSKSGGNGTVTSTPKGIDCGPTCTTSFNGDTSVTLTATPDTGYSFMGWSGDCSGTTAKCTLTMDAAKTATALFLTVPITYPLTIARMGLGSGTTSGGGNYAEGATVTLKATAAAGSKFVNWSPNPCAASFKMPAKALTCKASFALAPVGFALNTLVAGTGTGTVTGAGKYAAGAMVALKATPAKGSSFVGWAPTACSASFFMPGRALTCVAMFSNSAHTLTTVMGGLGTGTITGAGSYAAGARVTLKAIPAAGSTFVGWAPTPCGASFVMPAHALVCAAIFN